MKNSALERFNTDFLGNRIGEIQNPLSERLENRLGTTSSESVLLGLASCACSFCAGVSFDSTKTSELSQDSSLSPNAIISSTYGDITKGYIDWDPDGGNTSLTYTVFDTDKSNVLFTSLEHSDEEEALIDETFAEVDSLIELDFVESESVRDSEIVVLKVEDYLPWMFSPGVVGQVVEGANRWFVLWRPTGDPEFDVNTILHEIGHGLGLSHPNEFPSDPRWNTVEDTMMSYNAGPGGQWGLDYTDIDSSALTEIWGVESTLL
ncbi:hypothetical protein N9N71_01505 [Synechococcus sp. AH-229-G18]|nr:hypothetical protein [Synechococcus sp. AH-229-G18]